MARIGKRAKHGLGSARPVFSIRIVEVDCLGKPLRWNVREARRSFLVGKDKDAIVKIDFPSLDPAATKTAVSVENQICSMRLWFSAVLIFHVFQNYFISDVVSTQAGYS